MTHIHIRREEIGENARKDLLKYGKSGKRIGSLLAHSSMEITQQPALPACCDLLATDALLGRLLYP